MRGTRKPGTRQPGTKQQSTGQQYEQRAQDYLAEQGIVIIARNFSARTGEIDLVGQHQGTVVFVEVRARSNPRFPGAGASVDRRKQQRIMRTAQVFLQQHRQLAARPCRFDVIAFEPPQSGTELEIRWIRGAFTA